MSMAAPSSSSSEPEVMMEMNMTPLIDVMLVLIIMLIITIPVQNHSINLNMPTNSQQPPPLTDPIVKTIDVDFDGTISWDGEVMPIQVLETKLIAVAAMKDQPEVHLRPNKLVAYKSVAAVMAMAQRLGVTKIGMVGNEQFLNQ